MRGSATEANGFPTVIVAYSLALYNFVLALVFVPIPAGDLPLTTMFGLLGTIGWLLGGLLSHSR